MFSKTETQVYQHYDDVPLSSFSDRVKLTHLPLINIVLSMAFNLLNILAQFMMLTVCVLYFTILNVCLKKILLRTCKNQLYSVNVSLYFLYVLKDKHSINIKNVKSKTCQHYTEFNVKFYVLGFLIYSIIFSCYNELYLRGS